MAEVNPICGVCGRLLNRISFSDGREGWGHSAHDPGDHIPVPVEYDESILASYCDFCGGQVKLEDRWFLPVEDFAVGWMTDERGDAYVSTGGYACCPDCASDLKRMDLDAIETRYIEHHPETTTPSLAALIFLWAEVVAHVQGSVRPWQPGDEASGSSEEN